jgi:DnaJ-domain-containing protein 1
MPRIILKPKSPEYADSQKLQKKRCCDMPGCPHQGNHKAPKHRGLNDYYCFCFEHIKEYNKAWDFFFGMSEREVQEHMTSSLYGDRPTWRYDSDAAELLYEAARKTYFFGEENNGSKSYQQHSNNSNSPEHEALALMGLSPPVTLEEIKTCYKKLAKKYHPDLNRNNKQSEELLKKINMAYTILKLAFKDYSNLIKRDT